MALPDETLEKLRAIVTESSAQLQPVGEGGRGTGFFIDEGLVLTCAHVVKRDGVKVVVRPYRREDREGTVVGFNEAEDLALVEVPKPGDGQPQPAVVLDTGMTDGTYSVTGYPRDDLKGDPGLSTIDYRSHLSLGKTGVLRLIFEAGQEIVTSGLSGGAVLNRDTGAVVGVVQYSRDTREDSGGGAIPIERAVAAFPDVARRAERPPPATRPWRDVLGRDAWGALGKAVGWRPSLDLVLTGSKRTWGIRIDPDEPKAVDRTARDIPDEVVEALFEWAEWRRMRTSASVSKLGRHLGQAVFPTPVAERILRERADGNPLLRLRIEPESDLFNVPWEFLAIADGDRSVPIAAELRMGFTRVANHPDPDKVRTVPQRAEARILAIVVQPPAWQERMPTIGTDPGAVPWPEEGEIGRRLQSAIQDIRTLRVTLLDNPQRSDIRKAIDAAEEEQAPFDIVHYIGFGRGDAADVAKARLAIGDGYDGAEFRSAGDVFDWVKDSHARLFVAELALPPMSEEWEAVPPRVFLGALGGAFNAVVSTRFVHPRQFAWFNDVLYEAIGEGKSIEDAVQEARTEVRENDTIDAAGFGWFTLLTGPRSDTRFVLPSTQTAPGRSATSEPPVAATQAQPDQPPAASGDDFGGST